MSLLRGPRGERRADSPTNNLMEMFRRRLPIAETGVQVDDYTALTHSAVYECVDLIADLVSGMPVLRYKKSSDDPTLPPVKAKTRNTLFEDPSTDVDAMNWRRIIIVSWLMRGYAAGLVTGTRGQYVPAGIELIHPDRLGVYRMRRDAKPMFTVDGHELKRWPEGPLWIAPGKMLHPEDPLGQSVLQFARPEISIGIAARSFGAHWFRDGGHPSALLIAKGDTEVNQDLARRVKRRFLDAVQGTRDPVVLGGDWEYKPIQIRPDESQFLDTIKANRTLVAGFFRVPPMIIGAPMGTGLTYQNVEAVGIDLLKYCIQPWVNRMETVLTLLTTRNEFVKLDVEELLRTDITRKYTAHDIAIRGGWRSPNEARVREGSAPIDGGDRYLWPPWRRDVTEPEDLGGADYGPDALIVPLPDPDAEPAEPSEDEPAPFGQHPPGNRHVDYVVRTGASLASTNGRH